MVKSIHAVGNEEVEVSLLGNRPHLVGSALLLLVAGLLSGCDDDENSFRSLDVGATATGPTTTTETVEPVRVLVVGDVASPEIADFLAGRGFEVTNLPYARFEAAHVDMAGDYLVWTDDRNGNLDIYGYRISTATEFPISTAGGVQRFPRIDGDYVVWEDYRGGDADIYAYRLSTGTVFPVSTALGNQRYPRIDGDMVVWEDARNGNTDIYAYRFSSATEMVISAQSWDEWRPEVVGDNIVWQAYRNGFSDIEGYRISSATPFSISAAVGSQYSPALSETHVIWVDNRNGSDDIYAYELATGQELLVSAAANQQLRPQLAGDYAVWQDFRNGDYDIYAYHFPSASEIPVAVQPGAQTFPVINGDLIAWQDARGAGTDIYAYRLSSATEIQITDQDTAQSRPVLSDSHIAWLDGRRGLLDVRLRPRNGGSDVLATTGWQTPAAAPTDLGDNEVLVLGSDIFSQALVLQLFDAAVAADMGVLGLGGGGVSLAAALAQEGRYGLSVTPASGCAPMQIVAERAASGHVIYTGINTAGPLTLESSVAVSRDELAITTAAGDPNSPADWQVLATFGGELCNAGEPALVSFSTASGTPVILDGSAGVADAYRYWLDIHWTMVRNAVNALADR